MYSFEKRKCCHNCENLRVDNFCLVKGKYILSKNIEKRRECRFFELKHEIPALKIKQSYDDEFILSYLKSKESKLKE